MIPKDLEIIGKGPCPWGCPALIHQSVKSAVLGFCPLCRRRTLWTGKDFERSDEAPPPMDECHDDLWRVLRRAHCAHPRKKKGDHACAGTVSFSPLGMELKCRLCGYFLKARQEALEV